MNGPRVEFFCPSRGRATTATTPAMIPGVRVFVRECEADEYRARGWRVDVQPESATGNMARVRNAIIELAEREKIRALVMVDDDLSEFIQWVGPFKKARKLSGEEVVEIAETMAIQAEESGCRVFGMNQIHDRGAYRQFSPFSFTNIILGPFLGVLLPVPYRFDDRLGLKEDYDFSLQALNVDRRILRFNAFCYVTKHLTLAGGCAFSRTTEREREQFERLRAKWGGEIIASDSGASHKMRTKKATVFDPNPRVRVPIAGI